MQQIKYKAMQQAKNKAMQQDKKVKKVCHAAALKKNGQNSSQNKHRRKEKHLGNKV